MIPGIVASGQLTEAGSVLPPPAVFSVDGGWSWFSDPRAIVIGDGLAVGAIRGDGRLLVYDMQSSTGVDLRGSTFDVDDHANPSLLHRSSDGKILVAASAHNGTAIYTYLSTNPDDPTAFGAETNIDAQLGGDDGYSYDFLIQLTGEVNDPIYLFFRGTSAGTRHFYYSTSTDQGATWAARTRLLDNNGDSVSHAPYVKAVPNGDDRIDFFCTDGHPANTATNSIYHFYYEGGAFKDTGGSTLTLPIAVATDLTPLYDGTTDHAWIHDAAISGTGNPACVFATFPTTTDHRYHYRKWNGTTWDGAQVCTAGGYLTAAEVYYSGGIAIDPDNVNIVYASREINQEHQIWRYVTADDGDTWDAGEQITQGPRSFRPHLVRNATVEPRLLYMSGDYQDFAVFDTDINLTDSDTPEVTLPTDAQHASTCLICNFHGPAGATTATDYSPDARTATFRNNAIIEATNTPFGVSCLLLDGNGDTVTFANHADFQFGSSDFTVEVWAAPIDYTPASEDFFISLWRSDNNQRSWGIRNTVAGALEFLGSTNGTAVTTLMSADISGLAADSWHHFAVKRASGVFTMWVDGSQVDTDSTAFTFHAGTGFLNIGNIQNAATGWSTSSGINGRIGPVRITNADRTITLPTAAFPIS
jgi:hypothetical protein